MLPLTGMAPRGGRGGGYRSYYFLPQYFRRIVKPPAIRCEFLERSPSSWSQSEPGTQSDRFATGRSDIVG
eukprot:6749542-Pyramimonas_sp.AAC.1